MKNNRNMRKTPPANRAHARHALTAQITQHGCWIIFEGRNPRPVGRYWPIRQTTARAALAAHRKSVRWAKFADKGWFGAQRRQCIKQVR